MSLVQSLFIQRCPGSSSCPSIEHWTQPTSIYYRCNNYVANIFFCFSAKHDVAGSMQALIGQILRLWCRLQSITSCLGQGKPRVVEHCITVFNTKEGLTCQFCVFSNKCVTVLCVFWLNSKEGEGWLSGLVLASGLSPFPIQRSILIVYCYEEILRLIMCPWFVSSFECVIEQPLPSHML